MKTLTAQLEVRTQEHQETILNWKVGKETLRRKVSQWKEGRGEHVPKSSQANK